jgi:quercetin dioxygenase-like cupin family protein
MVQMIKALRMGSSFIVCCALLLPATAIATDRLGVVSNVILGHGVTTGPVHEQIRRGDSWSVNLDAGAPSDFYFQDEVVAPGGHTGWHSHPGVLMVVVTEGSIDFYDKDCRKRSFSAGQAFTESADPHNAFNTGTARARFLAFYIMRKGEPRRIEQPRPPCAVPLQLP